MKVNCIDCIHSTPNGCVKNSKNGYLNCAKYRAIPIPELEKERKKLLISKEDPERLEYLTKKIIAFNGGTI